MNPKLTSISTLSLLDELSRRMLRAEHDARRVRSVAQVRAALDEAFKAGCSAGKLAQLTVLQVRLQHVLDEAAEHAAGSDTLEGERAYRRALWTAIEAARTECGAVARTEQSATAALRARLDLFANEVLRPEEPLRARFGSWLYSLGERISSVRGAS